ncbi:hypothetical protein PINS_up020732 [Pythium insidiosum]|nr:hypothetical protein PINS_up020732 [Pythium insidiosum]
MARAYVTLLTSDAFSIGVEALAYSLFRTRPRYPLVVLHTPQVSAACCAKLERFFGALQSQLPVSLRCVPDIGIPELTPAGSVHVAGWVNSGYSKLHVFALEEFEKIVYIDADCLVLENVDDVCWFTTCNEHDWKQSNGPWGYLRSSSRERQTLQRHPMSSRPTASTLACSS